MDYKLMKYIGVFIFILIAIFMSVLISYTTTQNISGNYVKLKLSHKLIYIIFLNVGLFMSYILIIYPLKIKISKNKDEIILERIDVLFLKNVVKIKNNSKPYLLVKKTNWTGIVCNVLKWWEGEFKVSIIFIKNNNINSAPILLNSAYVFGALIGRALLTKEEVENIRKFLKLKVQFK